MTILVVLDDESTPNELMLIDHVNSETVRIPLNDVDDVLSKIKSIYDGVNSP